MSMRCPMAVIDFKKDARIRREERHVLREFCTELGGDPVKLALELGLKVFTEDLPSEVSGFIQYDESCGSPSSYKIVINAAHSVQRQRFTVAHEIGHFVLHRDTEEFLRSKRQSKSNIFQFPSGYRSSDAWDNHDYPAAMEREADVFAAKLLLPAGPVRNSPEFQQGKPVELAIRLGLSPAFVVIRFDELL